jgi:small subunit ribosomal protein S5
MTWLARKNMKSVKLKNGTLQYSLMGRHGAPRSTCSRPLKVPASSPAARCVRSSRRRRRNVLAKCIGTNNPINVVRATMNGAVEMDDPDVAAKRGKTVEEILG